ncbi:MAG: hypothetical protein Kow00133_12810 [Amphiplicatus sp.]|jgi:hypothetical protein
MSPRIKKLVGLFVLLPGLAGYFFAAAALGERVPSFWLFQAGYYLIAGIAWAFPAKFLIQWMNREPS